MSLEKAFKLLDIYEETGLAVSSLENASEMVDYLSKNLRHTVSSNKFFSVSFTPTKSGHGVIILKYANIESNGTHSEAQNKINLMLSIDGFSSSGKIISDKVQIDVFKFNAPVIKLQNAKGGPKKVCDYIIRWFKNNIVQLTNLHEEDAGIGGQTSDGGPVKIGGNGTSLENLAVKKEVLCTCNKTPCFCKNRRKNDDI